MERQMTLAEINDELGAARTNKKEFLDVPLKNSIIEMLKVNKIVKVFKEKSLKRVGKGAERNVVFFNFKKIVK